MLRPTLTGNASFSLSTASSDKTSRSREQNATTTQPEQATADTTVSLSQQAKDFFASLEEDREAINRLNEFSDASRKADARARLEAIKREIERLKAMLMRFGDASAYVLKQLKQLSSQLSQAATQLGESSSGGAGSSSTAAYSTVQSLADGETGSTTSAVARTASSADGQTDDESAEDDSETGDSASIIKSFYGGISEQLQKSDSRNSDEQLLKDVVRELRALLSMIKSKMRDDEKDDSDVKKDIASVEQQLDAGEQAAQQINVGTLL